MGFQPFPTSLAKNLHPSPHATGINFQDIGNLLGRVSFQQAANGKEPTVLEFSWQAFASHPGNDTTCQVADITFVRRYKRVLFSSVASDPAPCWRGRKRPITPPRPEATSSHPGV